MVCSSRQKMKEKKSLGLIDTHAHLASSKFIGEVPQLLERAQEAGVQRVISIACDIEDSEKNLSMAKEFPAVAPTVGVHPLYVHEPGAADWQTQLKVLAARHEVVAIGEIGLDYFHPPQDGSTEEEWRSLQREFFEHQLDLAISLDLPVVIHQRNSAADVHDVLKNFPKARAVLHCFTGTIPEAEAALEMGHLLSYTGIVTFPNAAEVQEAAKMTPSDRIMLETDCPYLAPVPFRGKRCEPAMVCHTASKIAELHGISEEEIICATTENAMAFFRNL